MRKIIVMLSFLFSLTLFAQVKSEEPSNTQISSQKLWSVEVLMSGHMANDSYTNFHGYFDHKLSDDFYLRFGFSKSLNFNQKKPDIEFEGATVTNRQRDWSNFQVGAQVIYYFGEYRHKNYFIALGPSYYSGEISESSHYSNPQESDEILEKDIGGLGLVASAGIFYSLIDPVALVMEVGANFYNMSRNDKFVNRWKSSSDEGFQMESLWVRCGVNVQL